jgi:hypothetical protein
MAEIHPAQIEKAVEDAFARERIGKKIIDCMHTAALRRIAFEKLRHSDQFEKMSLKEYQAAYRRAMLLALMTPKQRTQYLKNELALLKNK